MKQLVHNKVINKSILTDGISLPKDCYELLNELTGRQFDVGESTSATIVIDNEIFNVALKNSNAQARKDKLIQFRWALGSVGNKMRSLFPIGKVNLIADDGGANKECTTKITEYVNIYAKDSYTFIFDCHMKLNDTDFELCKNSLTLLAAAKAKPFLILGGFSGTGKSMKVKELAYLTCPKGKLQEGQEPGNYCLISVKPNWHDSTELLGYYSNIAQKYVLTDFVKFLVKAMKYPLVPFYVCMDEMNLAPVEEYFAEYLSVLESRKEVNGQIKSASLVSSGVFLDENTLKALELDADADKMIIEDLQKNGLCLPQNIIVIGTINMDDTTNSFSRKVIDRAMTIETKIESIDTSDYFSLSNDVLEYKNITCPERFICDQVRVYDLLKESSPDFELEEGKNELNDSITSFINEINKAMGNGKNYDASETVGVSPFQVSYRVLNETVLYYRSLKVLYPSACSLDKVFADILLMKVLPRIEGEQDRARKPLEGLQQFVSRRISDDEGNKTIWTECANKIEYMLKPFGKGGDGFTTFWL